MADITTTANPDAFPPVTMKSLRELVDAFVEFPVETPQCVTRMTFGIYANTFGTTWCGARRRPMFYIAAPPVHYEPPCPWCLAAWYAHMRSIVERAS